MLVKLGFGTLSPAAKRNAVLPKGEHYIPGRMSAMTSRLARANLAWEEKNWFKLLLLVWDEHKARQLTDRINMSIQAGGPTAPAQQATVSE